MDNGLRIDFKDMARVVGETWRTLTSKEKAPYEADARKEMAQFEQDRKKYEEKHKVWADLHHKAKASGQPLFRHLQPVAPEKHCTGLLALSKAQQARSFVMLNVVVIVTLFSISDGKRDVPMDASSTTCVCASGKLLPLFDRWCLTGAGLIKAENGALPAPTSSLKAAAHEEPSADDDRAGTSPKSAAKPASADTAQKVCPSSRMHSMLVTSC